jgi:hypothetical protein
MTDDKGKIYEGEIDLIKGKDIATGDDKTIVKTKMLSAKIPEDIMRKIIKNLKTIKAPHLVAIILKFHGSLTKSQQLTIFKKLGKGTTTFNGGNYTRDMIRKGLVHDIGKISREPIYGLTEKGKQEANMAVKRLTGEKNDKE